MLVETYNMLTILGPTASGKTSLAAAVAYDLDAEIISADSRQLYRGMDIGTGKDIEDYVINGKHIPYYLIDIVNPGYKYNLFEYQRDFLEAFNLILNKDKLPILCGGTGLYIESVLKSYRMIPVPENRELRTSLEGKSLAELTDILSQMKQLHNITDVDTSKRAIRAIEIQKYYAEHPIKERTFPEIKSLVVGIDVDRDLRRQRITERLKKRLEEGMIEEIKRLLDAGIKPEDLIYYGLEYKYITLHVIGKLSYDEMFNQLEIAIHQFAKRQMTWFRGMERRGVSIHWINASLSNEEKLKQIKTWLFNL